MSIDLKRTVERHGRDARRAAKAGDVAGVPELRGIADRHLPRLIEFIAGVRKERPTRKTYLQKSLTTEVWDLIKGVPDDALASAVISGVMLAMATPPRKDDEFEGDFDDEDEGDSNWKDDRGRRALEIIGHEIEWTVQGFWLDPKVAAKIEKAAKHKHAPQARRAVQRKILREDYETRLKSWGRNPRIDVGAWAFDSCLQVLPDVFGQDENRAPIILQPVWDKEADVVTLRMLDHPVFAPSLKPPKRWDSFYNRARQPFLRHCRDVQAAKDAITNGQMRRHLDAVSYLQSTAWRINEPVLELVDRLGKRRSSFLAIKGKWDRGDWRVFDYDMEQATKRLRGKPFWTDMSCDTRGRVYPIPAFNYSRGDHIRALFKFAHGAPITERGIYWLRVKTADCFRSSRRTFDERAAWAEENLDRIRGVLKEPMARASLYWLSKADDPLQFVAHAIELTNALDAPIPAEYVTNLPISFDASSSGAQHYAMLALDRRSARITNLLPDDIMHDLYEEIRDIVSKSLTVKEDEARKLNQSRADDDLRQEAFPNVKLPPLVGRREAKKIDAAAASASWIRSQDLVSRKATKPLTVTRLYGQKQGGHHKLVRKMLHREPKIVEKNGMQTVRWHKLRDPPKAHMKTFVDTVRAAQDQALPAAGPIEKFVARIAEALALAGKVARWTSPSGVPVVNEYKERTESRHRVWLGRPFTPTVAEERPELDKSKCRLAAPPNLIHSLDAAHLALVALACEREGIPLACVHDSFAVLPGDADKLRDIWSNTLADMYKRNSSPLQEMHDYARSILGPEAGLPDILPRGTLDPNEVRSSRYGLS